MSNELQKDRKETITKALQIYEERIGQVQTELYVSQNVVLRVAKHPKGGEDQISKLAHLRWMITEINSFMEEDRMYKANRWLGFIQGMLFSMGISTLQELKDHNRRNEKTSQQSG